MLELPTIFRPIANIGEEKIEATANSIIVKKVLYDKDGEEVEISRSVLTLDNINSKIAKLNEQLSELNQKKQLILDYTE